jgi:hypothetical protein
MLQKREAPRMPRASHSLPSAPEILLGVKLPRSLAPPEGPTLSATYTTIFISSQLSSLTSSFGSA